MKKNYDHYSSTRTFCARILLCFVAVLSFSSPLNAFTVTSLGGGNYGIVVQIGDQANGWQNTGEAEYNGPQVPPCGYPASYSYEVGPYPSQSFTIYPCTGVPYLITLGGSVTNFFANIDFGNSTPYAQNYGLFINGTNAYNFSLGPGGIFTANLTNSGALNWEIYNSDGGQVAGGVGTPVGPSASSPGGGVVVGSPSPVTNADNYYGGSPSDSTNSIPNALLNQSAADQAQTHSDLVAIQNTLATNGSGGLGGTNYVLTNDIVSQAGLYVAQAEADVADSESNSVFTVTGSDPYVMLGGYVSSNAFDVTVPTPQTNIMWDTNQLWHVAIPMPDGTTYDMDLWPGDTDWANSICTVVYDLFFWAISFFYALKMLREGRKSLAFLAMVPQVQSQPEFGDEVGSAISGPVAKYIAIVSISIMIGLVASVLTWVGPALATALSGAFLGNTTNQYLIASVSLLNLLFPVKYFFDMTMAYLLFNVTFMRVELLNYSRQRALVGGITSLVSGAGAGLRWVMRILTGAGCFLLLVSAVHADIYSDMAVGQYLTNGTTYNVYHVQNLTDTNILLLANDYSGSIDYFSYHYIQRGSAIDYLDYSSGASGLEVFTVDTNNIPCDTGNALHLDMPVSVPSVYFFELYGNDGYYQCQYMGAQIKIPEDTQFLERCWFMRGFIFGISVGCFAFVLRILKRLGSWNTTSDNL